MITFPLSFKRTELIILGMVVVAYKFVQYMNGNLNPYCQLGKGLSNSCNMKVVLVYYVSYTLDICSIWLWLTWYPSILIKFYPSNICCPNTILVDRYDTVHGAKIAENRKRGCLAEYFQLNQWSKIVVTLNSKTKRK